MYSVTVVLGPPIFLVIAWWLWLRRHRPTEPTWRSTVLLAGLWCASANVCTYFVQVSLARHFFMSQTPQWRIFDLSDDVGLLFVCGALAGALVGIGKSRLPLAVSAVLASFWWLHMGIYVP